MANPIELSFQEAYSHIILLYNRWYGDGYFPEYDRFGKQTQIRWLDVLTWKGQNRDKIVGEFLNCLRRNLKYNGVNYLITNIIDATKQMLSHKTWYGSNYTQRLSQCWSHDYSHSECISSINTYTRLLNNFLNSEALMDSNDIDARISVAQKNTSSLESLIKEAKTLNEAADEVVGKLAAIVTEHENS